MVHTKSRAGCVAVALLVTALLWFAPAAWAQGGGHMRWEGGGRAAWQHGFGGGARWRGPAAWRAPRDWRGDARRGSGGWHGGWAGGGRRTWERPGGVWRGEGVAHAALEDRFRGGWGWRHGWDWRGAWGWRGGGWGWGGGVAWEGLWFGAGLSAIVAPPFFVVPPAIYVAPPPIVLGLPEIAPPIVAGPAPEVAAAPAPPVTTGGLIAAAAPPPIVVLPPPAEVAAAAPPPAIFAPPAYGLVIAPPALAFAEIGPAWWSGGFITGGFGHEAWRGPWHPGWRPGYRVGERLPHVIVPHAFSGPVATGPGFHAVRPFGWRAPAERGWAGRAWHAPGPRARFNFAHYAMPNRREHHL